MKLKTQHYDVKITKRQVSVKVTKAKDS